VGDELGTYAGTWDRLSFASASYAAPSEAEELSRPASDTCLRLLHVGPCFMNGGTEQHLLALAKFLDARRVRFERCLVTGRKYVDAGLASRMPAPVAWADVDTIRRAVRDCDVLLTWGLAMNDLLGQVRPKVGVFLAHGESDWTRAMLLQSRRCVDHVIAVSHRVAERVCPDFDHTVVLNGVDTARLAAKESRDQVRARYGFSSGDFVLGSVSRLVPDKRVEILIEAVARLPAAFKLLVAGWGEHRSALLELANDRIPGRYAFAHADDYLGDLYSAMDAFGLASAHEGFGLVVAEALLCGVPVVATRVGCVPEVLRDRVSGLIVDACADAFAGAAKLLRDHPEWARGLAAEGRSFARQRLHASRMAREYEDLLARLWRARPAQERRR
jgi:glycosyltransferase involved in cell wall biosynthesis